MPSTPIRIDDNILASATIASKASHRPLSKQIEYWTMRMAMWALLSKSGNLKMVESRRLDINGPDEKHNLSMFLSSQQKTILALLILVLLTFAAYFPALSSQYLLDDIPYFIEDPLMTAKDGLQRIWLNPVQDNQGFWPYLPLARSQEEGQHEGQQGCTEGWFAVLSIHLIPFCFLIKKPRWRVV